VKTDKAKTIVLEIAQARRKWGKQANPPYSIHQIMDALVALSDELQKPAEECGGTPEEVTKLRRQLAACQNREKARKAGAVLIPGESFNEHDPDTSNGLG
jgi:polyhydroxyalkanoate synthesis regulator phasin